MSNAKPAARITDRTQHGGALVTGSLSVSVEGPPAARKDDLVLCPGGPQQITGGAARTFFGANAGEDGGQAAGGGLGMNETWANTPRRKPEAFSF